VSVPRVAVVPGDGIGVEVIAEAVKALHAVADASGKQIRLTPFDWGAERYLRTGVGLPKGALEMLQSDFDAILLGAMGDPRVPDNRHAVDILLGLRFDLDLYVNHRPVRLFHEKLCPLKGLGPEDVNFVVFRENTEGPYVMMGGNFKKGTADEVATEVDLNTRKGVERIVRHAFAFAERTGRKKVVMADKSNVLVHAHDLWQRVFKEVAAENPSVEARHLYIDNLALQLVRDPRQFEVIVTSNMFGDIVTDLAAGLQGGLGMAASGNLHPGRVSLFEPVHGSSPPLAGKNVANPMGAILTSGLMLEHLGWGEEASRVEAAVRWAVEADVTTADIGGAMGTREVGDAIVGRLRGSGPG
jgi:3-isopropylmalate dehydrogenase